MKNFQIGQEVVRSKGDYVVGYTGKVIALDPIKNRAQVDWKQSTRTWVTVDAIECASIPHEIYIVKGKNKNVRKYRKI